MKASKEAGGKCMKTKIWWYRVASMISLLFALGHTIGFLRFRAPSDEGRRVWTEMNDVHFTVGGQIFSYGGFYLGFGLTISAMVLFLAALMWWLGNRSREETKGLRGITWMLVALEVGILALTLCFFGIPPTVLSALTAIVLMGAAIGRA
jgi:hypothetical protein